MNYQPQDYHKSPFLGVGIGLRRDLFEDTMKAQNIINWVEYTPENYMARSESAIHMLEEASKVYPLVAHGVSLSLGSTDPWNEEYLDLLEGLFTSYRPEWFSDHLSYSAANGFYFHDLIPLPYTDEAVKHVSQRIKYLQDRFDIPFIFENPSYYIDYPYNQYSEAEFIALILEKSHCGLLLDVNNVYVNCQNRGTNPYDFLAHIPLEKVVQIHVAGHHVYPDCIIDTHGSSVSYDVWEILKWVLSRCTPKGVMLERDLYIPPFSELQSEIETIWKIWSACNKEVAAKNKMEFV